MTKPPTGPESALEAAGRAAGEALRAAGYRGYTITDTATAEQRQAAKRARIVGAIRKLMGTLPDGFTGQQVCRMSFADRSDVVAQLGEYVAHGLIEVVGTDLYARTKDGVRSLHPTSLPPKDIA